MCAFYECGIHTQGLSIPNAAVAVRKSIALLLSQSAKKV